ncbi:alpha/beta-hydrolase [Thozetella sp. PMI_491]|nr:alpha/beta-hydrolase [Thozetella sp. PMI_491]
MSAEDAARWALRPWTAVMDGDVVIGWRKHHVPYRPDALSLQTLDVWVSASGPQPPGIASLPANPGHWLVFIHGGAWRDPLVTSSAFEPTAERLLKRAAAGGLRLAGLASISYRLSPHPQHPTDPSPPRDGSALDPARVARHPDHIADVLSALWFLQSMGGATDPYLLSGHSCGATLAFQAVMNPDRWAPGLPAIRKPAVVVGLSGLYDLAGFVEGAPPSHASLVEGYEDFIRGAFGDDRAVWKAACPTSAGSWTSEWTGAQKVVLAQSRDDSLVPYEQLEGLRAHLQASEAPFEILEREIHGDHDELWQEGSQMANIYEEVLQGLR